jgi:hypothetical protein
MQDHRVYDRIVKIMPRGTSNLDDLGFPFFVLQDDL